LEEAVGIEPSPSQERLFTQGNKIEDLRKNGWDEEMEIIDPGGAAKHLNQLRKELPKHLQQKETEIITPQMLTNKKAVERLFKAKKATQRTMEDFGIVKNDKNKRKSTAKIVKYQNKCKQQLQEKAQNKL
jgi:hypothetical protein